MRNVLIRPATCKSCPFRGEFHLSRERRLKIHHEVVVGDLSFPCHSETYYLEEDDDEPYSGDARHCAGAGTLGVRSDDHNQNMRIAGRLGETMPNDPNVPFRTWDEWINEPKYSMDDQGRGPHV